MPRKTRRSYPLPILSIKDWSARDRAAWEAALRPASLFEDRDSLACFPRARIGGFAKAWGRWLGYLEHMGTGGTASGLDYLGRTHLQGFLDVMMTHLASCTVRAYLTDLWTVARHLDPDQPHRDLHRATLWIWRTARPEGNKMQRIVPAADLYGLGFDLMDRAETIRLTAMGEKGIGPQRTIELYRDGLMIAMLTARPLRIGNFAQLELDRHVLRLDDHYRLVVDGDETKAGYVHEIDLPDSLTGSLDTYIEAYRPRLLARRGKWSRDHDGTALWINRDGAPYRPHALSERISKVTARNLGRQVNPHLFRDCVATSIAVEVPGSVGIIAPILGHASARTAERHYNQARNLIAGQKYLDVIASLREEKI